MNAMNKITTLASTAKNGIVKTAAKGGMKLKKYSPEILVGVGVVSIVSGVVLACRATLKAEEILDEHEEQMEIIQKAIEVSEEYLEQDQKRDKVIAYAHTAGKFIKLYAPSIGLLTLGIGCMLGSYGILKKRNVALMAAYEGVQKAFLEYRQRVRDEIGTEKEECLYHGVSSDVKNDAGETLPAIPGGYVPSVYARFFDEWSPQWSKSNDLNKLNLLKFQDWANDLLHARGHLFLNEVYDMLGLKRSSAGAVVGWVEGHGDGYVDFGIFNVNRPSTRDFINGYERAILLDFNVDGVIWDLI